MLVALAICPTGHIGRKSMSFITFGMIIHICGFLICSSSIVGCVDKSLSYGEEKEMLARKLEEVLKDHTDRLMSIPGVVGTGQGLCNDKPCIKVFVIKKTPDLEDKIPAELEGYPNKIEETGIIRPLPENGG
ncbi:MAG: hypothetical protein ACYSUJ_13795 [Planctomycetota bacterium]|jgi:hypothetical protein